jgi:hypothetical protein
VTPVTVPAEAAAEIPAPPRASSARKVLLLGPQRKRPVLAEVLAAHGIRERVAVVSAGMQEAEGEVGTLDALGTRAVDLRLHARADVIFGSHPDVANAHRGRQEVLRSLRRLYDLRLMHAMSALVELERRGGAPEALAWERTEALEALRELDARHLARLREVQAEWSARLDLANRPAVVHHRAEVRAIVRGCEALVVAGGHVAILANRLRFFDVLAALRPGQPVVGWSGGAMVLTDRVVVYHDSPPWGPGNAEVFDGGLGLARDVVALPDARRRLRLDDAGRVARFARRFAPASCVTLEEEEVLELGEDRCRASAGVRRLAPDGTLAAVGP